MYSAGNKQGSGLSSEAWLQFLNLSMEIELPAIESEQTSFMLCEIQMLDVFS